MTITCFIVDDEPSAVDLLRAFVAKVPFLTLTGSATNPVEALASIHAQPVQLVFLDIHMPQLSGMDFMRLLQGKAQVIFTTAYSEFAVESFELQALDYLLKPIAFERFLQAVQRMLPPVAEPGQPLLDEEPADHIFVKTKGKGKWAKASFNDIVCVEGMKNYVIITTPTEQIVTLLNIKDLEERLPTKLFMRVHKSYIVSLEKIGAVDGNQILLKGQKQPVALGDKYRPAFFQALQEKALDSQR